MRSSKKIAVAAAVAAILLPSMASAEKPRNPFAGINLGHLGDILAGNIRPFGPTR